MAHYCYDAYTGALNHWPWPNKSLTFNMPVINAMRVARHMAQIVLKNNSDWTNEDNRFYEAIYNAETNP